MAKSPNGSGGSTQRPEDLHLTPDRLSAIRQQGVVYRDALDLAPGEYTVRFVVRDDLSGRYRVGCGPVESGVNCGGTRWLQESRDSDLFGELRGVQGFIPLWHDREGAYARDFCFDLRID